MACHDDGVLWIPWGSKVVTVHLRRDEQKSIANCVLGVGGPLSAKF